MLLQYNLTNSFQMKLKTTKVLLEPSYGKNQMNFWPTQYMMFMFSSLVLNTNKKLMF